MKKRSLYASMALVCFILGVMISVQFKTNYTDYLWSDQLSAQTVQSERLRQQNDELINEMASLQEKLAKTDHKELLNEANTILEKASITGGLTDLTGPGVVMVIDYIPSSDMIYRPTIEMEARDILTILNELKAAGSEAICVNDLRLVAASPIDHSDSKIRLNGQTISSPYKIKAIGNREVLYSSMLLKGGEIDNLMLLGYKIDIKRYERIEIPRSTSSHE